jgi:putative ABC transport system permease protein
VVAVVASALGVVAGVGVAEAIKGAMNVFGVGIPDGPLTLELRTVVVGMAVGVVVTMVAAIIPARKAASVPPVAAMRAEAVESTDHSSLARRAWSGTALTLAGAAAIAVALVAEVSNGLTVVAAGALTAFIGVSVLAPLIARPVANAVGAPLRGIVGRLARENTLRNPRRTSSTASALMIGVALVAFVSIFAASIKASVSDTVSSGFPTDLAFASTNQMMGVTDPMLAALGDVEEIETLSAVRVGGFEIDGVELDVAGVDPATIGAVYAPSASIELDELGDGILVQVDELAEHGWAVGDTVSAAFPQATYDLAIEGTFEDQSFGNYLVSAERFEQGFQDGDAVVAFARLASGIDIEAGREAAKTALSSFPTVDINTKSDQIAEAEAQIDQLVALFTGLLGLALLIAVMGIANTLALSIVERTRELGLLRAVGMDRSQVRSMIRWEAVIVALFGTLMGLGVGSVLGWAVIASLGDDGLGSFAFPATQLATWAIAGGLAGVVAAVFPARSAARLNVLEAISYE